MFLACRFNKATLLRSAFCRSRLEPIHAKLPARPRQSCRSQIQGQWSHSCGSVAAGAMFYSELHLDRAEHLRKKPEELAHLAQSAEARLIPWKDAECLFVKTGEHYKPVMLTPLSRFVSQLDAAVGHLFVGLDLDTRTPIFAGKPCWAAVCGARGLFVGSVSDGEGLLSDVEGGEWLSLRTVGAQIDRHDAALMAAVNGMMEWHVRNLFYGSTGEAMLPTGGGYSRRAETNGAVVFPRIDPAIICLVTHGEHCLLGRKHLWKNSNRYSLLAGYLEVGETLEQAVEREVFEESGVKVDPGSIQYQASQPWPFPQSLMVGFRASVAPSSLETRSLEGDAKRAAEETGVLPEEWEHYAGSVLPRPIPQPDEMEDVRWFHADFVKAALSPEGNGSGFCVPGPHAIANSVFAKWLADIEAERVQWAGHQFAGVEIDEGRFKYILARISDGSHSKIVVRGKRGRPYHINVYEELKAELAAAGLEAIPLGGGRIEHDAAEEDIFIYGYSSAFGTAVHEIAEALCRRAYPKYAKIRISYSGY